MKICMISGGHLPIPSSGWGGVEVLITNYFEELKSLGHEVLITNTANLDSVVKVVNDWSPDFVLKQFDKLVEMGVDNVRIIDEMFTMIVMHPSCQLLMHPRRR